MNPSNSGTDAASTNGRAWVRSDEHGAPAGACEVRVDRSSQGNVSQSKSLGLLLLREVGLVEVMKCVGGDHLQPGSLCGDDKSACQRRGGAGPRAHNDSRRQPEPGVDQQGRPTTRKILPGERRDQFRPAAPWMEQPQSREQGNQITPRLRNRAATKPLLAQAKEGQAAKVSAATLVFVTKR